MPENLLIDIRDLKVALQLDEGMVGILDGVNLTIKPGRVLALVGESGCGKSVTAQSILRLLPRELKIISGKILFSPDGDKGVMDFAALNPIGKEIRRIRGNKIGMIFQEPMSSFSPLHTFGNQIGEVIRLHRKVSKKEARKITIKLLDKVGIPDPAIAVDRYPHEFSGGMRQRAMIARALSCNPSLLIADEPTTSLDVTIQAQILELMRDLQKDFGMAVIFITHNLGVVAQIAHQVAIMYMGRIIEHGPVEDIYNNPKHPYTSSLINAIPHLRDLREQRELFPIQGDVPSIFDKLPGCTFHPRCEFFMPGRCNVGFPQCTQLTSEHSVSCFLYDKDKMQGRVKG